MLTCVCHIQHHWSAGLESSFRQHFLCSMVSYPMEVYSLLTLVWWGSAHHRKKFPKPFLPKTHPWYRDGLWPFPIVTSFQKWELGFKPINVFGSEYGNVVQPIYWSWDLILNPRMGMWGEGNPWMGIAKAMNGIKTQWDLRYPRMGLWGEGNPWMGIPKAVVYQDTQWDLRYPRMGMWGVENHEWE